MTPIPPGNPGAPQIGHVVLVVEENHSYSEVIGNSSMPYLNGLAGQFGLATQYYADAHPSIPNYFMLVTGEIETLNDSFSGTVSDDNLVRELVKAGKTWMSYAESLPMAGYTGGDAYPYLRRHNPFSYLSDVLSDSTQASHLVPFTQFAADLSSGALPQFAFIAPNAQDDAHDGSLAQADMWLQQNIQPLIASPLFQKDGLLLILFDESTTGDFTNGGGHVAAIVVGPGVKKGFQSQTMFQHQSSLRFVLESLGVSTMPGASSGAADMREFLQ